MKFVTKGASALAAGTLFLVGGAQAASAEDFVQDKEFEYTFTNSAGGSTTCTIAGFSVISRASTDDPFDAQSGTSTFGFGTGSCNAVVRVTANYVDDTSGARVTRSATAQTGNDVVIDSSNVRGGYSGRHNVVFTNCSADCTVDFSTSPK